MCYPKILTVKLACVALAAALILWTGFGSVASADELSARQIIDALKPSRVTRGLILPADLVRIAEEARELDTSCNPPTRALIPYEKLDTIIGGRPSVDLEINFEYNSDKIGAKARSQVTSFGQALTSDELRGSTFFLAGHTDAKGSDPYNFGLSMRRAVALKGILSSTYRIEQSKLVACGYGKTKLKDPAQPYADFNRRVTAFNLSVPGR